MKILKSIPLTALLLCLLSGVAKAQVYSAGATPEAVGTISVMLGDGASDACWTNLREVREYAEEKLRSKGYKVVPEDGNYRFALNVESFRDNRRSCIFTISTQIFKATSLEGIFGFHKIGTYGSYGVAPENANNEAITAVQKLIDKM